MSTAPATATNETKVREIFRRLFDERDLSDPYALWSDESVDHFLAAGQSVRGAPALAEWFAALFAAVPDWRLEIDNVVDDGADQVVVQWTGTGTFSGSPFLGLEATGRRIEVHGCDVIRLDAQGRVGTNTVYYDGALFARQVGMLPATGSRTDRAMTEAFNALTRLRRKLAR
jgi:steroid delta-isomerase-like uncharacterized protein